MELRELEISDMDSAPIDRVEMPRPTQRNIQILMSKINELIREVNRLNATD